MSSEGVAELSDFMQVEEVGVAHNFVRRVKIVRGEAHFRMVCAPRFDYGRAHHRVEQGAGEVRFVSEGTNGDVNLDEEMLSQLEGYRQFGPVCIGNQAHNQHQLGSHRPLASGAGNFPQALTHLALISAAYDVDRRLTAADRTD